MSIVYKSRSIDQGQGVQYVEVTDGIVTDQWIKSKDEHRYTGDGNPEIVGKTDAQLRGMGFRRLSLRKQNETLERRANQ